MNCEWIVYKTTNMINGNVYVGVHKTKIGLYDGYIGNDIYCDEDAIKSYPFHKAVRKYGYSNFVRETLFSYPYNEEGKRQAFKKEAEIVNRNFLKRKDVYNACLGGKVPSSIHEREVAQYNLDGKFINSYFSIAYAASITKEPKSSIQHCCSKLTYSNNYQWRYFDGDSSNISKAILKTKAVYQFDLNGNYITYYKSAAEAEKSTNISQGLISAVCCNRRRSGGGFYWSFKKQFNYKVPSNISKQVACYDDNDNLIKVYQSVHQAADDLHISRANILACIKGKHKHCKKMKWRFYNNKE